MSVPDQNDPPWGARPRPLSRRGFLRSALAASSLAPILVPASALGRGGAVAPSRRISVGFIGIGYKGADNLRTFLGRPEVQVVALCDVDRRHLEKARAIVEEAVPSDRCLLTTDYRDLTRRPDIDAVVISTPDHWHVLPALDAVRHGKDCYVEKPLTLTIEEGRLLADEVARHGRILQTGSQQRSIGRFRFACESVRNGRIGELRRIEVLIPGNGIPPVLHWEPETPPEELDYDRWLGPAPWRPYHPARCHYLFRFLLDYSGGQVTNWGAHYLDIAQWALDADGSGPVAVEGKGVFPREGLFDTATQVDFRCTYANGVRVTCRTRTDGFPDGAIRFVGTEGWLMVNRTQFDSNRKAILRQWTRPHEIRLPRSYDHVGNFLECVRTRQRPVADAEIGHRSATVCHLGNIAMRLGRRLQWDPAAERFVNDDQANALLRRTPRAPWEYGAG